MLITVWVFFSVLGGAGDEWKHSAAEPQLALAAGEREPRRVPGFTGPGGRAGGRGGPDRMPGACAFLLLYP